MDCILRNARASQQHPVETRQVQSPMAFSARLPVLAGLDSEGIYESRFEFAFDFKTARTDRGSDGRFKVLRIDASLAERPYHHGSDILESTPPTCVNGGDRICAPVA